ncbi:hypothetical protein ACK1X7_07400 [Streptomyces sp. CY1]|uniref:hypothetical protein n=1 Tax=Streptomyces sp. CY1 TaxID=3388313 RepID=UPI0039A2547C
MARIPDEVAKQFVKVFRVSPAEVAPALQCLEVNALAAMLAALGASEAAEDMLSGHLGLSDCTEEHRDKGE